MFITYERLMEHGACSEWVEKFQDEFPDGLEFDPADAECVLMLAEKGFGPVLNWPAEYIDMKLRINLSKADLREAYLRWADLFEAYLSEANLFGADLFEANLFEANLIEANLRGADLRGADLRGADLSGADLSGADLSGVVYDEYTIWPAGFNPPPMEG